MLNSLEKLPFNIGVACSGGPDSMAIVDLLRLDRRRTVNVLFFHHGTTTSDQGLELLQNYCTKHSNLILITGKLTKQYETGSKEMFWREERYKFLNSFRFDIITGHHLDDAVETYLFNIIRSNNPKTIPYRNKNIIRPFLLNRKEELVDWCNRKNVPYIIDVSNDDVAFTRNRIRHNIIPQINEINPGFHTLVRDLVIKNYNNYLSSFGD